MHGEFNVHRLVTDLGREQNPSPIATELVVEH